MIIEPARAGPRGRARRALGVVGLMLPAVLLAGVVVLGVTGPKPAPAPTPSATGPVVDASPIAAAPGTSAPGTSAPGTSAPGTPGPGAEALGTPAPHPSSIPGTSAPTVAADLAVLHVPDALAALRGGDDGPLAVTGYLVAVQPSGSCVTGGEVLGQLGPLCERTAVLTSDRAAAGAGWTTAPGTSLAVRVPVGVQLPLGVRLPWDSSTADGGGAPEVIMVGGSGGPATSCEMFAACGTTFTVDRVVWAAGEEVALEPVLDAGVALDDPQPHLRSRTAAETLATGWSGTILVAALVRPATVGAIDPTAAARLRATRGTTNLVWYIRGLETAYDPMRYPLGHAPPRRSWVVLDDATGAVLASGKGAAVTPGATTSSRPAPAIDLGSDAYPESIGSLRVHGVATTLATGLQAGGDLVAVAGYARTDGGAGVCATPAAGPDATCEQQAVIADVPFSRSEENAADTLAPRLLVRIPAGVPIPADVWASALGDGAAVPVVVVGTLGPAPEACTDGRQGCAWPFTAEVVGSIYAAQLDVAPLGLGGRRPEATDPLAADARDVAELVFGRGAVLVRRELVPPGRLAEIDPKAASAVSTGPGGLPRPDLWYLRGLVFRDDPAQAVVRWAVVVQGSPAVLASGDAGR